MDFGAAMFFADYAMGPGEPARTLEARGFESVWAPEHSHIPISRDAVPPRRRTPKEISRSDGPVRHAHRRGGGDRDSKGRDGCVPRYSA